MSIASLLLAFLSAAAAPSSDSSSAPVLLNFHAEWCGPCHKARPAVDQLIRDGLPIKKIDIDEERDLARRYHVEGVPAFIVVDRQGRELDRISGPRSASELSRFYKNAAAKARPPANSSAHVGSRSDLRAGDQDDDDEDDRDDRRKARREPTARERDEPERSQPTFSNPKPWETVVRIKVIGNRTTGFGSGTVVYSTPKESLILTCAHIFKIEGRKPSPAAEFPRKIMIDLFDGKLHGQKVNYLESVEGKAVDYDFNLDVGLIRIRPGRRLPASRIVPAYWELQSGRRVLTVGCSEGRDATAWHTVVKRPRIQNFLSGNPNYEAIECDVAPKEGRSGGGLYTIDGYVAGVCNFAEPQGNHGLYATPRSIYSLLNRNHLAALYAPVNRDSDTLVADRGPAEKPRRNGSAPVTRSQSPDVEEPARNRGTDENGDLVIPDPSLLGISDPTPARTDRKPVAASGTTRRASWQATLDTSEAAKANRKERAELSSSNPDSAADGDRFETQPEEPRNPEGELVSDGTAARSSSSSPAKTHWRAIKIVPAKPADSRTEN